MTDPARILERLPSQLRDLVGTSVPLRELTTLRIGGPAALCCRIENPEHARRFLAFSRENDVPHYILGAGSNVLAADAGYPGLVFNVATAGFRRSGDTVTVGSGLSFDDVIRRTLDAGLTGLEFASGIPGTLGGALVGNAGCYGREIGEFLVQALVLKPDGLIETMGPEDFGFRYRATSLRESGHLVLEATLRLARGDLTEAGREREERIADRLRKHPVDLPCAGSWFRNLPPSDAGGWRQAAGKLLDEAGAKDFRQGDAGVFAKHANIIVNHGQATAQDVLELADRMKRAVLTKFGVELEEEVRYLGGSRSAGPQAT